MMMTGLRKIVTPTFLPPVVRQKLYPELWQKEQIKLSIRAQDDALTIKTHPLPYLELLFEVQNDLPVSLQIYGVFVEVWIGKPVVQFNNFVSETLQPGEFRASFRGYTFLNNFQADILNPPKKDNPPPNVSLVTTISCRSLLGAVEKTVRTTWKAPRVVP